MKRTATLLMGVLALVCVAGWGRMAASSPLAAVRCQFGTVSISAQTGTVSATVHCASGGSAVTPSMSYAYSAYDVRSNLCGTRPRTGQGLTFDISPPGAARVEVVFRAAVSGHVFTTQANANLGGTGAECARLTGGLAPSAVCAWGTDAQTFPCGSPYRVNGVDAPYQQNRPATWPTAMTCQWSTPPTLRNGTVSAGHIACGSGVYCWSAPLDPREQHPYTDWLGQHLTNTEWKCSDGTTMYPALALSAYPPGSQQTCSGEPYDYIRGQLDTAKVHITRFQLPMDWGGRLGVTFFLYVAGKNVWEQEDALFDIPGTASPCSDIAVPKH